VLLKKFPEKNGHEIATKRNVLLKKLKLGMETASKKQSVNYGFACPYKKKLTPNIDFKRFSVSHLKHFFFKNAK